MQQVVSSYAICNLPLIILLQLIAQPGLRTVNNIRWTLLVAPRAHPSFWSSTKIKKLDAPASHVFFVSVRGQSTVYQFTVHSMCYDLWTAINGAKKLLMTVWKFSARSVHGSTQLSLNSFLFFPAQLAEEGRSITVNGSPLTPRCFIVSAEINWWITDSFNVGQT